MPPIAVSSYELSVFVHVAAVVVGLGATFAGALAFPLALRLDPRHLPYAHALSLGLSRWFATPALVVILLTGLYQTSEGDWSLGDAWISATFAILIVIGGLNGAYFIPTDRRLGAQAEREIAAAGPGPVTLSDDYTRAAQREGAIGALTGVLVLVAVFLMVTKPGA